MNDECDDDAPDPDSDREPPESGPYCRHYRDPADCDITCVRCGHPCCLHEQPDGDGDGACRGEPHADDECPCEAWVEPEDE
jgi:hypothetical protein